MFDLFAAVVLWFRIMNQRLAARVPDSYGMYYARRIRRYASRCYISRLVRAHHYHWTQAQHRYRRGEKQVTARTPLTLRTYGQPRLQITQISALDAPVFTPLPPADRWENTDAVLADTGWLNELQERLAAAHLIMKEQENVHSSDLGRNPDPDGAHDRPAQSVHSRAGWGGNRGYSRSNRGGRLQRPATGVPARNATLLDLVHEDDFAFPVPQLRRLPQPAC